MKTLIPLLIILSIGAAGCSQKSIRSISKAECLPINKQPVALNKYVNQ